MGRNVTHRYIIEAQIEELRDAAHVVNESKPLGRKLRDEVIVCWLYDTGTRNDEMRGIRPDGMIDLENEEVRLPSQLQKDYPNENSPSSAVLDLDKSGIGLIRLLRNYLNSEWYRNRESDYLIPTRQSEKISEEGLRTVVRRVAIEADIRPYQTDGERAESDDLCVHDFRHSVSNWMLSDGHTMTQLRNRLRHRSSDTTERVYEHFTRG